jgi:isochorismate hydrolase
MVDDPKKSRKEVYVTEENLSTKTQKWLNDIKYYSKNKARFKFIPSSSALLVIDMQQYFLKEESHAFIPSSKAIVPNIRKLINTFRSNNLPVIFTRHSLKEDEQPGIMGKWWGDFIKEESVLSDIVTSMSPLSSEVVIRKTRYSVFHGTELESLLKQKNVRSVVITGVMTHLCCETAAREAFTRDYEVFFVVDGTATQNEELHLSSLRTLSHGFSIPITTEEILSEFQGMRR